MGAALLLCGTAMLARRLLGASIDNERDDAELTLARRAAAVMFGLAIAWA